MTVNAVPICLLNSNILERNKILGLRQVGADSHPSLVTLATVLWKPFRS